MRFRLGCRRSHCLWHGLIDVFLTFPKIHRPASLAAFHPCYNKILSADKFLRKTWNRFPFILFCCVKDLGYLSCCNNHKQIEHKKIYGKNAHVDKLPQNSAKRWSEHDTDISRSHLRSHNWLRNIFSEILRRQIVKVWEKGGRCQVRPKRGQLLKQSERVEAGEGGALRLKYTDRFL